MTSNYAAEYEIEGSLAEGNAEIDDSSSESEPEDEADLNDIVLHNSEEDDGYDEELEVFTHERASKQQPDDERSRMVKTSENRSEIGFTPSTVLNAVTPLTNEGNAKDNHHCGDHSDGDANDDNDDEFSFEPQSVDHTLNQKAISSAIDSIVSNPEMEAVRFSEEELRRSTNPDNSIDGALLSGSGTGRTGIIEDQSQFISTAGRSSDRLMSAKKALDDIMEAYAGGAGDVEVLMADIIDKAEANRPVERVAVGQLFAVAEGEEEEEEEQEEEKDRSIGKKVTSVDRPISSAAQQSLDASPDNQLEQEFNAATEDAFSEIPIQMSEEDRVLSNTNVLTYEDALSYLVALDLSRFLGKIIIAERTPMPQWKRLLGSQPTELNFAGSTELLQFPFLIAELDYDPTIPSHLSMLTAVYSQLLPVAANSPLKAIDDRWELIGFQGRDPRTDVNRSMKLLAILQMLAFLQRAPQFCRYLFDLSLSAQGPSARAKGKDKFDASWPFMCVSIMFTKEALQALRRGDLNSACNKAKNVITALHQFYHGCFIEFARQLRAKPTVHHAILLGAVRDLCAKSPAQILNRFSDSEMSAILKTVKSSPIPGRDASSSSSVASAAAPMTDDLSDLHDLSKIAESEADATNGAANSSESQTPALSKKAARFAAV